MASCALGCQLLGGARIQELATGTAKPSNVAILVAVTEKDKPVAGLPATAFKISENDQPIDAETAQLQLVEPARYAAFHAVLLVDTSQAKEVDSRKALAKAAAAFVRRVRQSQPVTVVAYDGSEKVRVVGEYSVDAKPTAPEQVDALMTLAPGDPSRNLRGAIVQGLAILNRHLATNANSVPLGTLAVFARGPDLAGRTQEKVLDDALSSNKDKLVFIGVTGDTPDDTTKRVAQSGQILAQSADTIPIAFENAGALVDGLLEQYYVLSYCSPARAGTRNLKVVVSVPVPDGKDETDSFEVHFDSAGFAAGCDSQNVPPLVSKSNPAPTPAKTEQPKTEQQSSASTGKAGGSSPSANEGRKSPAKKTNDQEAPVPAKPGYAQ
jgi:hypothetical protein